MMGEITKEENGGTPSPTRESEINIHSLFLADYLQYLKYNLQDQVDFDFHDIAPLFSQNCYKGGNSPIINGFLFRIKGRGLT